MPGGVFGQARPDPPPLAHAFPGKDDLPQLIRPCPEGTGAAVEILKVLLKFISQAHRNPFLENSVLPAQIFQCRPAALAKFGSTLALAHNTWLLEITTFTKLRKNTISLHLLLETTQQRVK